MAEEIKKILSIEVNGERTVKDLKKEISDLKDALLNVEKGSDDYRKIVDKLIDDEKELTNVMSIGKREVKAAAGSYNALSQEMSALKKVFKEVTDEAERNRLAVKINEINDKLKDMDASVGVYSRNVGNYQSALNGLGGILNNVNPALGKSVQGLSGMAGQFKNLEKVIGKVTPKLAAAGVAILAVVAAITKFSKEIKEAINRNDEFRNKLEQVSSVGRSFGVWVDQLADRFVNWLAPAIDAINTALDNFINRLSDSRLANSKIGKWLGLDQLKEINKTLDDIAKSTYEVEQAKIKFIKDEADSKKKIAEYDAIIEDKTKSQADRQKAIKDKQAEELRIQQQLVELKTKEYNLIKDKNSLTKTSAADARRESEAYAAMIAAEEGLQRIKTENMKASQRVDKQSTQSSNKKDADAIALIELTKKLTKAQYEADKDALENEIKITETKLKTAVKGYEEENKLQLERLKKKKKLDKLKVAWETSQAEANEKALFIKEKDEEAHNERLAKIQKNGVKTLLTIDENYAEEEREIMKEYYLEQDRLAIQAKKNQVENLRQNVKTEPEDMIKYLQSYLELQQEILKRTYRQENEALEDFEARNLEAVKNVNQAYDLLANYQANRYKDKADRLEDESDNAFIVIPEAYIEKRKEQLLELAKIDRDNRIAEAQSSITDKEALTERLLEIEREYQIKRVEIATQAEEEYQNVPYQIKTDFFKTGEDMFSLERESLENFLQYIQEIHQNAEETDEAFYNRRLALQEEYNKKKKNLVQKEISYYQNYASAASSILGTVADALGDKIQRDKEAGKISEEESKRQFESVKALQYGVTWINTLSSMIGIFADSSIPTYYVKAALAAAQLASGIATTIQIKNTQLGGSASGGGASTPAAVTPIVTDYRPDYMQNMTGQSEVDNLANAFSQTPIYVSVTDINDVQNKVQVRDEESTF